MKTLKLIKNFWNQPRDENFLTDIKEVSAFLKNHDNQSKTSGSAQIPMEELNSNSKTGAKAKENQVNVVVIGAGMAGLSAASHLHKNGVQNITVLEALDRPGGRIQSAWFGDTIVELGSPFTKLQATNPIIHSAIEDGLIQQTLNKADPTRGLLLRHDESIVPYPVSYEVYNLFVNIWNEAKNLEESSDSVNLLEYIGNRIEQEVKAFPPEFESDANSVFHGLACAVINKSNHDTTLMKTNTFGAFIELPGSKLHVPLGHFRKIDNLYRSLPQDTVIFGKPVQKIRWGAIPDSSPRAVVECEDGETYDADFVISTIPVNVLKSLAETLFCPQLPISKINALAKVPQVHKNKIFIQFPQPFWMWWKCPKKILVDRKMVRCKQNWIKDVESLETLDGSDNVLCLNITGPEAEDFEWIVDEQVVSDVLPLITKITKVSVPTPVCLKRTCWSSQPQFLGASSCVRPNVNLKEFYNMISPLPEESEDFDPVILFAGEATSYVNYGTVEGAMTSGIREADRILKTISCEK